VRRFRVKPLSPESAYSTDQPGLRFGTLTMAESLGQSVANIAPTLTPALNVAVVAGLAGVGSWISYLISTVGLLFVGASIATLARRHPLSGSYFVYIGRTLGPVAGMLSGWAMIAAYLGTGVAVMLSMSIFLDNFLTACGLSRFTPPSWLVTIAVSGIVLFAVYRDIKLSSRIGLLLEAISVAIIIALVAAVVGRHGTVIDPEQFSEKVKLGSVMSSLTFAVFSFVGFESAATLAKETRNPERTIPLAVLISAGVVGLFFTVMAYLMVMGVNDDADKLGSSASPFADMAAAAGLPWAAGIVYFAALISGFACALASVNAASRMIFSMGRYKFFHPKLGRVHSAHRTPHVAAGISVGVVLVMTLAMTPLPLLDAFGYIGTFATFGFLVVYLLISVVSPMDLHKDGLMKRRHVVIGAVGALLMAFVIFGSVYPAPPYPFNWLPYLFAAYMVIGLAWAGYLKLRAPDVLVTMEHDMEEV
jgi:amino acid transporter